MSELRKRRKENPPTASTTTSSKEEMSQTLSPIFKEKKLRLSDDRFSVTGAAGVGYQSVCALYSASAGKWYYECTIEELPEGSHVRIGWSTRRTRFDQPIGCDCFSYALRDIDSSKISLGRRWEYGKRPLRPGDVVGCYITLSTFPVSPKQMGDAITFFPNLLCDPENVEEPDLLGPDAQIQWSINGESLGVAFVNLAAGEYYPSVSLFSKAKLRLNFGQSPFSYAPMDEFQPTTAMYVPPELVRPKKRPANFIPRGLTSGG